MSTNYIQNPIQTFLDTAGAPLSSGSLYFGQVGQNPETAPITVYWDYAATQPAAQPIKTINGQPTRNGIPAMIYATVPSFSMSVKDKTGKLVFALSDTTSIASLQGNLALTSGASLIGWIQAGASTVSRTVQDKLREFISVKDFGAVGDGITDDTAAIQAAINYCCTLNATTGYGGFVYMPPGVYKTTSVIKTYVGTTSCGLRGAGQFATQFAPSGNFTVLNIAGQRIDSGDFSIVFPTTAAASINSACVGVEFCSSALQMSYQTIRNITVYYAYRSFVMNSTSSTMYLTTLQNLNSLRAADWGFYLNSQAGSTTLTMNQCYTRSDNSVSAVYGSGMYINGFDDVQLNQCAIDIALNNWLQAINYTQLELNGCAFEGNSITVNNQRAVQLNGISTVINGVKVTATTYNTGGTANIFSMLGLSQNLTISGFAETGASITGTTVYHAWLNAATSHLFITDRSIPPSKVNDNGWFANHAYEGVRKTSSNNVPNYGTWVAGDYVKNGTPAVGQPKGWYCTVGGTPGTWVSEGNL